MGGVFSSPKVETPAPVTDNSKDREEAEAKARKEALDRQRRGMESNIKTSYTGILDNNDGRFVRKKLLGE